MSSLSRGIIMRIVILAILTTIASQAEAYTELKNYTSAAGSNALLDRALAAIKNYLMLRIIGSNFLKIN